jgi:hypothetical protein
MPEESGDRFQAHSAVDRLRGQGVAELVGMDVSGAGGGGALDGPVDA